MVSSPAARIGTRHARIVMKSTLKFIKNNATDSMSCKFESFPLAYTAAETYGNILEFHIKLKPCSRIVAGRTFLS